MLPHMEGSSSGGEGVFNCGERLNQSLRSTKKLPYIFWRERPKQL